MAINGSYTCVKGVIRHMRWDSVCSEHIRKCSALWHAYKTDMPILYVASNTTVELKLLSQRTADMVVFIDRAGTVGIEEDCAGVEGALHVIMQEDSYLDYSGNLQASGTLDMKVILQGFGAVADVRYAGSLSGDDQYVLRCQQQHNAARTKSTVLVRAALDGKSQMRVDGVLAVAPGSSFVQAAQSIKGLLLDNRALFTGVPQLAVATDKASCTHACAVGCIDPDQFVYLCSRGLSPEQAKKLLVDAFLQKSVLGVGKMSLSVLY